MNKTPIIVLYIYDAKDLAIPIIEGPSGKRG